MRVKLRPIKSAESVRSQSGGGGAHPQSAEDIIDVLPPGLPRRLRVEAVRVQRQELAQLDLPVLIALIHGCDELV